MKRSVILIVAAALLLPTAAAAKGPSSASISGPGGSPTLPVKGDGEGTPGSPLGDLVQHGGFFQQVYGQLPDPTLAERPSGDLGPKYTVTYVVPGPNGGKSRIEQALYPYARPRAVSYVAPGQTFWDGQRTHGGWFVATTDNLATAIGLPATAPSLDGGSSAWRWAGIAAAAVAAALAAALLLRRFPRTRPAAA